MVSGFQRNNAYVWHNSLKIYHLEQTADILYILKAFDQNQASRSWIKSILWNPFDLETKISQLECAFLYWNPKTIETLNQSIQWTIRLLKFIFLAFIQWCHCLIMNGNLCKSNQFFLILYSKSSFFFDRLNNETIDCSIIYWWEIDLRNVNKTLFSLFVIFYFYFLENFFWVLFLLQNN